MSRIDDLIAELCPDGVEYKKLGEVAKIKNGRDYKGLPEGDIPVYGSGGIMEARVGVSAYDKPTVLLPRKGSISNVFYVDKPFWNIDTAFYTVIDESQLIPRYFYHVMLAAHVENYSTGSAARPSLTQSALNKIEVPVPPMDIQQEIVKVLDSFITLEAELEARKTQYRYYRDQLLSTESLYATDGKPVEMKKLGDIVDILDSKRKPVKRGERSKGEYPYYGANGIKDYVGDFLFHGTFLLVGEDGSVITEDGKPIINWAVGKIWVNNHAHVLQERTDGPAFLRHLKYALECKDVTDIVHGTPPKLNQKYLREIEIPVPSLATQQKVVNILDRFDALTTSLTDGLPAEIEARRQQYAYYRDRLLTLPRKSS